MIEIELEQIVPGQGALSQINVASLSIERRRVPLLEIGTEARPKVLGLAGDDRVGYAGIFLRAQGRVRPANDSDTPFLALSSAARF